jgi:hypothetical protein
VDAQELVGRPEVVRAASLGRAMAWNTKSGLGPLLGEKEIAICAVRYPFGAELKRARAAMDAGFLAAKEGAGCRRRLEAR